MAVAHVDLELTAADRDVNAGQDPEDLTLGRFLLAVSGRYGANEAIVFEEEHISYARLHERVVALARGLVGAGVVKGARLGLLMSNRPEWIEAFYAAGMIGAVLVPINTFATSAERDYILRHGDVSVLLLERKLLKRDYLEELQSDHPELGDTSLGPIGCAALPQLRQIFCLGLSGSKGRAHTWDELLELGRDVDRELIDALGSEVRPSDDCLIIYTSGSTASPKGVLHVQRTAVLQSWRFAQHMRLDPDDRVWTAQPFFWTAGMAMSFGSTLAAGGALLLQPHFDPGAGLEMMERERATVVHAWPHQHQAMFEHPDARNRDLRSLTKVVGYSALRQLLGIPEDSWGSGPSSSFGMSETFTLATSIPHDAPYELRMRSRGLPIPGMKIRIVDPETGRELPTGEPGEITVKGVLLMRGYYKVPPEQWQDDDGYFHSGDGGWLDAEGHLQWTGRIDDLIKTGGANVSPLEIEAALDMFGDLRAARAIAVPHPTLGQAIVLCAVRAEGSSVGEKDVRNFLRTRLAAYKVPRRVLFFEPGDLDLTSNQKIRVAPLRAAALDRLAEELARIEGYTYGT
jgi:acyl-CoA synthetase (AMP-forming)/AMP-acid ligase II